MAWIALACDRQPAGLRDRRQQKLGGGLESVRRTGPLRPGRWNRPPRPRSRGALRRRRAECRFPLEGPLALRSPRGPDYSLVPIGSETPRGAVTVPADAVVGVDPAGRTLLVGPRAMAGDITMYQLPELKVVAALHGLRPFCPFWGLLDGRSGSEL